MSHHGSSRRNRSSNGHERPDFRIRESRSHSAAARVDRAEAHVGFDQVPDPSPLPRIYVQVAPTDPAYPSSLPPAEPGITSHHERTSRYPTRDEYHDSRRKPHRRSASYVHVEREKGHGYVASPAYGDSGRMPSIQQNYRPSHSRPEAYTTFTHMPDILYTSTHEQKPARASHRGRDRKPKISSGGGGGGDGGDIQTSAVEPAEPEPDTLNKIMICVFRNSKRQFVQKEVWMMKPGHRDDVFLQTSEYLRKDATFFKSLRSDAAFFWEIKWRYKHQLRGTLRQYLSFKTVSTVRVLAVSIFHITYHLPVCQSLYLLHHSAKVWSVFSTIAMHCCFRGRGEFIENLCDVASQ